MPDEYKKLIEDTILTIINQFHRKPFNFFNEHEFHQYCFHVFYNKKEFSRQFVSKDGKKTNILHPEYPTIKRYGRKKIAIDPKGKRARYDMAIFRPGFIEDNNMDTIANRDITKSCESNNLIAAFEFKYITKHDKKFQHEIDYDFFKLSNAREARLKYMLVFSNTIEGENDYFKSLEKNTDVIIVYTVVYYDNGKKKIKIKQCPESALAINK